MRLNRTLHFDDLPDDILGRIFALLPTKDRAMSEIVSKSWRRASLARPWERICLKAVGAAELKWIKLLASRNKSSLHVFEGDILPEILEFTILRHVSCFQDLRRLELKAMFLDPSRIQQLSDLGNLEWLVCDYAPYDLDDDPAYLQYVDFVTDLDDFADFLQLRHLAVVIIQQPKDRHWKVSLGSRFQGLTQLRSLKLGQIHSLTVDANLLQVAARLENFELESLQYSIIPRDQELNMPQLTNFVYKVADYSWEFPLAAAPRLLELTLHGRSISPFVNALQVCPKLTALNLALDTRINADHVQEWPDEVSMLRRLDLTNFEPRHPYVLHPFSALTRLETLRLHLCSGRTNVLASPNTMEHLKVLMLASEDVEPFHLGSSLTHLLGLKTLHLSMPHLTGEINVSSLEVLKLTFRTFKSDIKSGHQPLGNLPRLHTLHVHSELCDVTEILVLAHAIGTLRSLKDLVLLRRYHDKNDPEVFQDYQDVGFTRTMLRAISNTANVYNHVVIVDAGAVVLERSIMPHAQHLELVCSRLKLKSEQEEEDWFHRTNSLRVRLLDTKRSFESTPASVVEKLRCSPHLRVRRIQRKVSPTSGYSDYIEASKYEFSSLPSRFFWMVDVVK